MGQKKKILKLFFEQPAKSFQIREIAKLSKIPKTTANRYINELLKENLIKKEKKGVFPSYTSNETEFYYKFYKKIYFLEDIYRSGLIEDIEKKLYPKSIILFGSFAKAEYTKDSDIDIFVQAKEQSIDLLKFEKKLKHKINLFFEENLNNVSKELFNNIINGTKLAGYIKVK